MKNFDIENLERHNPFSVPENFFGEMQNKVLSKTVQEEKKRKVFKLDFKWAAAAAIILIAGLTAFLFNPGKQEEQQNLAQNTAQPVSQPVKSNEMIAYETIREDLTSVENTNPTAETGKIESKKGSAVTAKPVQTGVKAVSAGNTEQIDQVLAVFSDVELAEISKNSDQDVYLDLYN